jgi:hypothetical protein
MGGRRFTFLAAALALSAVAGVITSVSLAGGDASRPAAQAALAQRGTAIGHFVRGPVRGTVRAVQVGTSSRIQLYVSLHGLTRNMAYRVMDSSRPCSQIVDAADYVVWRSNFRASQTNDDIFLATRVTRRGTALSVARSVRVFDVTNPQRPFQRTCAGVDVWEHAY